MIICYVSFASYNDLDQDQDQDQSKQRLMKSLTQPNLNKNKSLSYTVYHMPRRIYGLVDSCDDSKLHIDVTSSLMKASQANSSSQENNEVGAAVRLKLTIRAANSRH